MTREEAKINLNMIRVAFGEPVTKEQRELVDDTFEMAIQALSQEPCETSTDEPMTMVYPTIFCEDAISREAVLDGLKVCICEEWVKTLFATMVKQLPPVTPSRRN